MFGRERNLRVGLAAAFLLAAALACVEEAPAVSVTINGPPDGGTVTVGQSVMIDSTASADAGVDRIELTVNGQMVRRDSPPQAGVTEFRIQQSWTPDAEGEASISVLAFDVNGESSATATILLQAALPAAEGSGDGPAVDPTEPPVVAEGGCTLDLDLLSETIPDHTSLDPGEAFVKVWNIRNGGTCDWEGLDLIFTEGTQMGGLSSVSLPDVAAGGETSVTMNMTAPISPGTYQGTWRLRTGGGDVFGRLWVLIDVSAPAADTPVPTESPTEAPEPTTEIVQPIEPVIPEGPLPYTEVVRERKSIPAGDYSFFVVQCPAESVLVGGGFAAPPNVLVYANSPGDGNGWRVAANNTKSSSITIDSFAVCLYQAGVSNDFFFETVSVAAGTEGGASAACPPGSVATGGGWQVQPGSDTWISKSFRGSESWNVLAENRSDDSHNLTAAAVCISGLDGIPEQVGESVSVAGASLGVVDAPCSGGLMLGGGFSAHADLLVYASAPSLSGPGLWNSQAFNAADPAKNLTTFAVCLTGP